MKQGGTMKKTAYLFVLSMLVLIRSAVSADNGYFTCGSDAREFSGRTFEDLTIVLGGCGETGTEDPGIIRFENITAAGEVRILDSGGAKTSAEVMFSGSRLNKVSVECSPSRSCVISLDGESTIGELYLYPAGTDRGSITVNGTAGNTDLPDFYRQGYLCEGQKEFEAYDGLDTETAFRMKDLEVFSDMGYIGDTVIRAAEGASVAFENVWLHRVKIVTEGMDTARGFSVSTKGMTYIDLLDSGISFSLHNLNERHFPGDIPLCSAIASDYMRIGLMYLHSDGDLSVDMDNQYVDRLVFFGNGCENSTLFLNDRMESGLVSQIDKVSVYDASAEFYAKKIPYAEFLIAPDNFTPEDFYSYFGTVREALRTGCEGLPEDSALCRNISQFPEEGSAYWDRMESAKVWGRLSGYVQIPSEDGPDGRPYYSRKEPDIPYFYTRAAYIDTVKFSSAYGVPENEIPSYIAGKGWASLNPTFGPDGLAGIAWNGGCSYNHEMTVGGITYRSCLEDLPFPAGK